MSIEAPGRVRTVLGDIPASSLGRTDYHDHLFQVSRLLPGDELDDESAAVAEAATLVDAGAATMVEATPTGLGRAPSAVARVSDQTGLHVVHVTGAHHRDHYASSHWILEASEDDLVRRFRADVEDGLPAADSDTRGEPATGPYGAPVRAGMVKAGAGYWRINGFEQRAIAASARVALDTGVPMMVHLEHGSAAWEVLDLIGQEGLPAHRVVLAHIDRNLDIELHVELASAGVYLGYDGPARHREAPDSALLDCAERVVASGCASRLLLGGDVARRSRWRAYGGLPGLDYLFRRFVPRLERRVGPRVAELVLVKNPARLLTMRPPPGGRAPRG